MNEKIQNPKTEVPTSKEMNDKDYLNAILETEKNMSVNLCIALNEASCHQLYRDLYTVFEDIKQAQRNLFELAFKKGWYTLEKETPNKIAEKYNMLNQELQELQNIEK